MTTNELITLWQKRIKHLKSLEWNGTDDELRASMYAIGECIRDIKIPLDNPYWIDKMYTDDGCCIYQCLNCESTWESRTAPGYLATEHHKEHKIWTYCPCCGCEWKGGKKNLDNR